MAVRELNVDVDGFFNLEGGANAGVLPSMLPANQYASGVNVQVRNAYTSTRPPFSKFNLTFENGEAQHAFLTGGFQGAHFYRSRNSLPYFVASIGGRIWKVPVETGRNVSEIQLLKTASMLIADVSFTVPGIGLGVQVTVDSTADLDTRFTDMKIGGKSYVLLTVDSDTQFTASNVDDTPGTVVPIGTEILFSVPDRNPSNLDMVWMEQAERYLLIQDGSSLPIIFDGAFARRSDLAANEIPVGTVMAYGNGRLTVARGRNFTVGDIVGGPSGTVINNFEDAVFKFTENTYLNGGGEFTFPLPSGDITALIHVATLNTGLGQGQLLIFTPDAVASANLPPNRDAWASVTYPIETVSLIKNGGMGQDSTVLVNGDVFFRSRDGLRSLIMAVRYFQDWGNTPISLEVRPILANDSEALLIHGSAILFNNRLLFTVSPVPRYNARSSHLGVASIDFNPVSTMRQKSAPAYDGVWTGMQPTQLLVGTFDGVERAFAFGVDNLGRNELWELLPDGSADSADEADVPVQCSVDGRSLTFAGQQDSAFPNLRELHGGDVFADRILGSVSFTVQYRPDQFPEWKPWHSWTICATDKDCAAVNGCQTPKFLQPQYRTRMGLPAPLRADETTDNKPIVRAYEFQPRIAWTGCCRLRGFRLKAKRVPEAAHGSFDSSGCVEVDACESDPFTYNIATYTSGPSDIFTAADNSMNLALI